MSGAVDRTSPRVGCAPGSATTATGAQAATACSAAGLSRDRSWDSALTWPGTPSTPNTTARSSPRTKATVQCSRWLRLTWARAGISLARTSASVTEGQGGDGATSPRHSSCMIWVTPTRLAVDR